MRERGEIRRIEIREPIDVPPILDPDTHLEMQCAFRPGTRKYWLDVANNKCQYEYYDERYGGWVECRKKADHVHHIIPEGYTLHRGGDPEENVGLPLCKRHHVLNQGDEEHSENFGYHPDIGKAYQNYPEWKRQHSHLEAIKGEKVSRREFPSPFEEVAKEHRQKTARGERYHNGSTQTDAYYEQKMRCMAIEYNAKHGINKPRLKEHPRTDRTKKRSWWSNFFDGKDD